jgi:hypothetical protein
MRRPSIATLVSISLFAWSCGSQDGAQGPAGAERAAEAAPQPYSYPAPVQGHYEEINLGSHDFVDGVAYPLGNETVVYLVSKPIASPVIAKSNCPMTEARALTVLRDAAWIEVTPDAKNRSMYFSAGKPFGGTGREQDVGGRYWKIQRTTPVEDMDRIAGNVAYNRRGEIKFDLPVSRPFIVELSEAGKFDGNRTSASEPTPTEEEVTAAYNAVRDAALRKDLRALLAAQGFDNETIAKIRGLAGIDADLERFSLRFLTPGEPQDISVDAGFGAAVGEGTNAKGEKFYNWYTFATCGAGRLVLSSIGENPQ